MKTKSWITSLIGLSVLAGTIVLLVMAGKKTITPEQYTNAMVLLVGCATALGFLFSKDHNK